MATLFVYIAYGCLVLVASIFVFAVLRAPRWTRKDEQGRRRIEHYDDL